MQSGGIGATTPPPVGEVGDAMRTTTESRYANVMLWWGVIIGPHALAPWWRVLGLRLRPIAFHKTLSDIARTYLLPARFRAQGVRRYGFHGLSVQSAAERVSVPRLVVCHLGGGSGFMAGRPLERVGASGRSSAVNRSVGGRIRSARRPGCRGKRIEQLPLPMGR